MWWFPWEKGSNPCKTPATQRFSFIFVEMIFYSYKDSIPLKVFQSVAWVIWYEESVVKAGCTPRLTRHVPPNLVASSTSALETFGCLVWSYQIWGPIRRERLENMPILGGEVQLWYLIVSCKEYRVYTEYIWSKPSLYKIIYIRQFTQCQGMQLTWRTENIITEPLGRESLQHSHVQLIHAVFFGRERARCMVITMYAQFWSTPHTSTWASGSGHMEENMTSDVHVIKASSRASNDIRNGGVATSVW